MQEQGAGACSAGTASVVAWRGNDETGAGDVASGVWSTATTMVAPSGLCQL